MRKFLENAICGVKDVAKTVGLKRALIGVGAAGAAVGGAFLIRFLRGRGDHATPRANAQKPAPAPTRGNGRAKKLEVKRSPATIRH
jgi:hypothetical protein